MKTIRINCIARLKKPHKWFNAGDLVVGYEWNGCANNLLCWGFSSKTKTLVGGRYGYVLRYCGDAEVPSWAYRAHKNAKRPSECYPRAYITGQGHLRIIKWLDNPIEFEHPYQSRDGREAWLRRLLNESSCGNLPLQREEAAPSKRILFGSIKSREKSRREREERRSKG